MEEKVTEFITLDWKNSIIQSEFSGGAEHKNQRESS